MRHVIIFFILTGACAVLWSGVKAQEQEHNSAVGRAESAAGASEQSPGIRFDGWYISRDPQKSNRCLRFFEDGTVVESVPCRPQEAWLIDKNTPSRGRFSVHGATILIEWEFPSDTYRGNIEDGRLRFKSDRGSWWIDQATFEFVEIDFAAAKRDREESMKQRMQEEWKAAGLEGLSPEVSIGTATFDAECDNVAFSPLPKPIKFPHGTKQLAYQFTWAARVQKATVHGVCGTRAIKAKTCTDYAVVLGTSVPRQSTTVVSCEDGKPFLPGTYKLQLVFRGEVSAPKAIPFAIR